MELNLEKQKRRSDSWVFFVASRFNAQDSRGRSAISTLFSVLGIAFGTTALIVILSVMNGFQMGYIQSILEVNSYHVRVTGDKNKIEELRSLSGIKSLTSFLEMQALMQGPYKNQEGVLLRAVDSDIMNQDRGFADEMTLVSGSFDLEHENAVVLGYELARLLSVSPGDEVSILAVSGSSETDLFPENASLLVTGLFRTGYYEIDNSFAFIPQTLGQKLSGLSDTCIGGIKLENLNHDLRIVQTIKDDFPTLEVQSWRTYNRAFFGALKVEKNVLFLLVILIFFVVTVNIYNGMRRSVYERKEEIAVLTALGGDSKNLRRIFIYNGLSIGFSGGILGLLSGLFLTVHINGIFSFAEMVVNGIEQFLLALLGMPHIQTFSLFSPDYFYILEIPFKIVFSEVLFVWIFGVLSASIASWAASMAITKLKPAEILRYE